MKKCTYCAEQIHDEAIVCRYCGRDLPREDIKVPKSTTSKRDESFRERYPGCVVIFLIIIGVVFILWVLFGIPSSKKSGDDNRRNDSAIESTLIRQIPLEREILGKWVLINEPGGDLFEFSPNGKLRFTYQGRTTTPEYEFVSQNRMKVTWKVHGVEYIPVAISGNNLILTQSGITHSYMKVNGSN